MQFLERSRRGPAWTGAVHRAAAGADAPPGPADGQFPRAVPLAIDGKRRACRRAGSYAAAVSRRGDRGGLAGRRPGRRSFTARLTPGSTRVIEWAGQSTLEIAQAVDVVGQDIEDGLLMHRVHARGIYSDPTVTHLLVNLHRNRGRGLRRSGMVTTLGTGSWQVAAPLRQTYHSCPGRARASSPR